VEGTAGREWMRDFEICAGAKGASRPTARTAAKSVVREIIVALFGRMKDEG
jgi:hypothetical protein